MSVAGPPSPIGKRVRLDMWWGRCFVSVVVYGIRLSIGWQWEGSYLDWHCSPVTIGRHVWGRGQRERVERATR